MRKLEAVLLVILPIILFTGIFFLPYAIWSYPLTQNWLYSNDFVLYRDVIYHHTPLPLFILFGASKILGNTEWMLRIVSYAAAFTFCFSLYMLARKIQRTVAVITLFLIILTFFPVASNFNFEEMFAALFSVLAAVFFFQYRTSKKSRDLIVAGALVGAAFMSKQIAVGIIPASLAAILYDHWHDKPKVIINKIIKSGLLLGVGMLITFLPILIYFYVQNALGDFLYWNITYNLFVYPKAYAQYSSAVNWQEGAINSLWIIPAVVAGVVLLFRNGTSKQLKSVQVFLLVATVSFLPAMLPSFHTYKFLSVYPYPLVLLAISIVYFSRAKLYYLIIVSILLFIIPFKSFYVDFLLPSFPSTEYIREYGEDEEKVMRWLNANTFAKERIMNLGHHYITTKTGLLPKNKYVTPFPWLLLPFYESSADIVSDPPRVVIIDNSQIEQFPVLTEWPFLSYVKERYLQETEFGPYEIWVKHVSL